MEATDKNLTYWMNRANPPFYKFWITRKNRSHAIKKLRLFGDRAEGVLQHLVVEEDQQLAIQARISLVQIGKDKEKYINQLVPCIGDIEDNAVRLRAIKTLAKWVNESEAARRACVEAIISNGDPTVRTAALQGVLSLKSITAHPDCLRAVVAALDGDVSLRGGPWVSAHCAVRNIGSPIVPYLIERLQADEPLASAASALGSMRQTARAATPFLWRALLRMSELQEQEEESSVEAWSHSQKGVLDALLVVHAHRNSIDPFVSALVSIGLPRVEDIWRSVEKHAHFVALAQLIRKSGEDGKRLWKEFNALAKQNNRGHISTTLRDAMEEV